MTVICGGKLGSALAVGYRVADELTRNPPMFGHKSHPLLLILLAVLLSQVGCVALNIPSQRLHDPGDKGGVLGHWNGEHGQCSSGLCTTGQCVSGQCVSGECVSGQCVSGECSPGQCTGEACQIAGQGSPASQPCLDGGPLVHDAEDPMGMEPPQAEVPWPRFHPVPTRPLLGIPTP